MGTPFHYIAALICVVTLSVGRVDSDRRSKLGVHVLLAKPCAAGDEFIRRDLVVRDLPDGRLWLNDRPLDESAVRSNVQTALTTRAEKLVWIAADEHLSYGEVVSLISKLRHDTPDVYIVLATKAQTGPVDPADNEFSKAQANHQLGVHELCVDRPVEGEALARSANW
jgi:3-deoxy-D-manno-octulosonic-acid transferase